MVVRLILLEKDEVRAVFRSTPCDHFGRGDQRWKLIQLGLKVMLNFQKQNITWFSIHLSLIFKVNLHHIICLDGIIFLLLENTV